jgi:hypothetical protein
MRIANGPKRNKIKAVEQNLRSLEEFLSNCEWPLLEGAGFQEFDRLQRKWQRSIDVAERSEINVEEYTALYNNLLKVVDEKNAPRISSICEEILSEYSKLGLLRGKEADKSNHHYSFPEVKSPF